MSLFDRLVKPRMVTAEDALPGRATRPFTLHGIHTVLGTRIDAPVGVAPGDGGVAPREGGAPAGLAEIVVGLGCFWGAERVFWQTPGVWTTAVGYAGGFTRNPTYEETCSGRTGHTEVVRVVYDPAVIPIEQLLKVFWEGHDPTQGMRQGNDVGTQYRSAVFWTTPAQRAAVDASRAAYAATLAKAGLGEITTDVRPLAQAGPFWYAEDYHQQYLSDAKNPRGYCGLGGTGVSCPVGVATLD